VKKAKTKPARRRSVRTISRKSERPGEYRKAALRSDAFTRAVLNASGHASDKVRLRELLKEASAKLASIPKESLKENWPYLQTMLRLTRAYSRDEYRAVSNDALLSIVAALNYLVDPYDLIPDEVPFLGFIDDATVISYAVRASKDDLDDFMTWETAAL
jgi:uncharacterized membrane protein YkvA (DUF1232 family)